MPVRARSRASSATRKSPQLASMARSSSRSAIVAGCDHAAVAHQRGGLGGDRAREQMLPTAGSAARCARAALTIGSVELARHSQHRWQPRQRVAQSREVARPRIAQCDAPDDPLDVDGAPQRVDERATGARIGRKCGNAVVPRSTAAPGRAAAASATARSRRLPAAVVHSSSSECSVGASSPDKGRRDLEVAPRGRVERQERARRARRSSVRMCDSAACCVAPA